MQLRKRGCSFLGAVVIQRLVLFFWFVLTLTLTKVSCTGIRGLIASLKSRNRMFSSCRSRIQIQHLQVYARRHRRLNHIGEGSCLAASLDMDDSRRYSTVSSDKVRRVYIAVGSNLGDRFQNIESALQLLTQPQHDEENSDSIMFLRVLKTSFLHETAPMYVTNQPPFLNGVVEAETTLEPHDVLSRIKLVEKQLGRDFNAIRNGPRPVDLDILFMDDPSSTEQNLQLVLDSPDLVVPHPRLAERDFVLTPLCELSSELRHPLLNVSVGDLYKELKELTSNQSQGVTRSLPLPRGRFVAFNETIVMGILNVTPDSFSDGGNLRGSVELATERALQMEREGARIIDVGGESTRPGAKEVALEEELERTIPVIRRIRQVSDIPISIDTRHSAIAKAAVEAGADIVNDVSGGTFDPKMLSTVADLQVPFIIMHMRGTPETMQSMTDYDDVVSEVAAALLERSHNAELAGIPRWLQVLDPGIGFAKDLRGNVLLLKHFDELRSKLGGFPLLLGTSRKGFIGKITGETEPDQRDYASIASCVTAICSGNPSGTQCNILRVHNVKAMKQAALIMDAISGA